MTYARRPPARHASTNAAPTASLTYFLERAVVTMAEASGGGASPPGGLAASPGGAELAIGCTEAARAFRSPRGGPTARRKLRRRRRWGQSAHLC